MRNVAFMKFVAAVFTVVVIGGVGSGKAQTWDIGDASNEGGVESVTATLIDGTLTVSGVGRMTDFSASVIPPWKDSLWAVDSSIRKVIIDEGVTSIGTGAFINCIGLNEVTIGNSVARIGDSAFFGCSGLRTINYSATNVTSVDWVSHWLRDAGTSGEGINVNIGNNVTRIPDSVVSGKLTI